MKGLGADQPYWQALSSGKLVMQQCAQCHKWHWPAVWRCGDCGSWEHNWIERPLEGEIFSWTRTWHDFGAPPELAPPFVSVVVTLDNTGDSRLLGVLEPAPEDIGIGTRVSGDIRSVTIDGDTIPAIRWSIKKETR